MKNFSYTKAKSVATAIVGGRGARYLGGGTNLVDLMRQNVETADGLIDVSQISREIEETPDGGVMIGAGVTNTMLANHKAVKNRFPVLSEAILFGASGQIRNMATVGGNLLQRTRCGYFFDLASRCNKRELRSGCDAIGGFNRMHAILGASDQCVAVFPSDMCVALAVLDATVHLDGPEGARQIPFAKFHRLPGDRPEIDNALGERELITAIELPGRDTARSLYRKTRDRASYAFALVSVAAVLEKDGGNISRVALALGGVAHKPWRCEKAEAFLHGKAAEPGLFRQAADLELADAKALPHNGFKIELAARMITGALMELFEKGGKR